ncbi:hypothetical protein FRC08_003405 [Ceratobasidium sp. 394]|nr:hypothetical protein FRC08_003405 [Ceratobasidium sp. 394]KAG9078089.1 hypothetical protein FS749_009952 [Ceratobasidium sp. UAMH 11750]
MSSSDLNNIKSTGTSDAEHHTHDPDYYYHDGNIVFLVDEVLFKIHASRFAPHSPNGAFTSQSSLTSPTDPGNAVTPIQGSSDLDPIALPEFAAEQFRNFLYLFYGSPIEPRFRRVLEGNPFISLPKTSKYYMDIAIISHHFGMDDTRSWALC